MTQNVAELFPFRGELSEIVTGNIRAEIARIGLDQGALGDLLGVTQSAASKKLNGQARWHLDDIEAIAAYLEIEPYELLIPPRTYKKSARRVASVSRSYTARDSNPEPID